MPTPHALPSTSTRVPGRRPLLLVVLTLGLLLLAALSVVHAEDPGEHAAHGTIAAHHETASSLTGAEDASIAASAPLTPLECFLGALCGLLITVAFFVLRARTVAPLLRHAPPWVQDAASSPPPLRGAHPLALVDLSISRT